MIQRILKKQLFTRINKGKAIIILGPRQVGKTTLLKEILENTDYLFLDGDDPTVRNLLNNANTEVLKNLIGNYKVVFIDEAQRIENIGLSLKIIIDQFKKVQLFVSGSSAFEMKNALNEPLTGRKWEYLLFPVSWKEFEDHYGLLKAEQHLELRLLYGMYPDVIVNNGDEYEVLKQLVNSYLYKDILSFSGIRKPDVLEKLLQALALQLGSEVSYNELSQNLGIDKHTVSSYIDYLEQSFIVFKLSSFSRNIRNEIKNNKKIYFYDNGVRNMIIGNFNPIDLRNDKGALWENFLISERIKFMSYNNSAAKFYFWRNTAQNEIDFVETLGTQIDAYEFKWKLNKKIKLPKSFSETYGSNFKIITRENFREFIK